MKLGILSFLFIFMGCKNPNQNTSQIDALYDYDIEQRLVEMGIELNEPELPPGIKIERAVQSGNLVFLSGSGPRLTNGEFITGKVGEDLTVDEGYEAARDVAINHLAILKNRIGDLNRVEKIVKVLGMVNASPSFTEHPKVINGYTDIMVEVFGERGKHARSAVGMSSLPFNMACEIEMIVQIMD